MRGPTERTFCMLNGTAVLIVEEEFLIALDIQRMLDALGAGQIFCARNAREAVSQKHLWHDAGLAVIDLGLNRTATLELIPRLIEMGVPVVLCSADAGFRRDIPAEFPGLPIITKPMAETELVHAIGKVFLSPA